MSILINKDTAVVIQGITGREAVNMTRELLDYGTKVVGGVTPGRAGRDVYGVPEVSINLADDPALMELMVAAGFDSVFVGIETPDEESLAECNKVQNRRRDLMASVARIQRAGLQVQGGFIVGFDSDPVSIFERQIDFIQNSGIVTALVGLLQAPVGTRLFERLHRENRLTGPISGDNANGSTNIIPKMGLSPLVEGYRKVLQQIYSPRHYYQRVVKFLHDFKAPRIETPMDLQRFLAFFRSCLRLGIIGRERVQYWRLMAWTLSTAAWSRSVPFMAMMPS